jgi:hypothetical protein
MGQNFRSCKTYSSNIRAIPSQYPQGYFKDKLCRECKRVFSPQSPSHLFCSQGCFDDNFSRKYLRKTYGITLERYRQMFVDQDNKCAICGMDGFRICKDAKALLVVDHCHTTGKVRGLLCHNCNRGLGLFQDNSKYLRSAIEYIERATTISSESTLQTFGSGSVQHPLEGDDIV